MFHAIFVLESVSLSKNYIQSVGTFFLIVIVCSDSSIIVGHVEHRGPFGR